MWVRAGGRGEQVKGGPHGQDGPPRTGRPHGHDGGGGGDGLTDTAPGPTARAVHSLSNQMALDP